MESGRDSGLAGRRVALIVAALAAVVICRPGLTDPLSYARREAAGVVLHVIDVDLNDPSVVVSPAMAASGRGRCETFSRFIARLKPVAAVNGTFFSKRTLLPVGDIVVDGKVAHFGGMGTAIAFASDGVDVIRLPKSRRVDWSEHRAALAGGPLLVWDGYAKSLPGGEGFGDPHVFARSAPRTAMGVTRTNHLLLVTTVGGSSLARLAKALRELGATYAVNLDGGSSCGMYYKGQMIRGAGRALTNVLAVYVKPKASAARSDGPAAGDRSSNAVASAALPTAGASSAARHGGSSTAYRSDKSLRPPRGLDWRNGHKARPGVAFWAKGIRFWVRLPRRWEEESQIHLRSSRPLPKEWVLRVRIDQKAVETATELPVDITLKLADLDPMREHEWRINLLDADGKVLGHAERIFRMGQPARSR